MLYTTSLLHLSSDITLASSLPMQLCVDMLLEGVHQGHQWLVAVGECVQ